MNRNPIIFILTFAFLLIFTRCASDEKMSDAYGNFEAEEVIVSAETAGKVLHIAVDEGNALSEGQLIAIIDTTDLHLKSRQLSTQRSAVKSQLKSLEAQAAVFLQQKSNLEKDLVRITAMLEDGAATRKQSDDIKGGIALAEKQAASVEAQRSSILSQIEGIDIQGEELERSIRKALVKSPMKGVVLSRFAEEGELVMPGKALIKIADLYRMKLKVYISGAQLAGLKLGQSVQVIVDKNGKETNALEGKISWISQEAEFTPKIIQTKEERVNMVYAIEVSVINDGHLKIGMPGEVNFN